MSTHFRRLATETLVYGLAGVTSGALSALLFPLYAHAFSPKQYGVIGVISTATALVSVLVVLGLDNAMARWYWDTDDATERKHVIATGAWCQLSVSAALAVIIALSANPVGRLLLKDPSAPRLIRLSAAALPFTTLGVVVIEWFRMRRRPIAALCFTFATSTVAAALTAYLLLARHWDVGAVYTSNLVASILGAGMAIAYMRGWIHPRLISPSHIRAMLRFSAPLVPAGLAYWVLALSDRFLLEIFEPLSQVGYYQVAATIAMGVGIVAVAFQRAWSPFAMSIHRDADAKEAYAKALTLYIVGSCSLAFVISAFSPELLRMLGATRYLPSVTSIPYLTFAAALTGLTYIATTGLSIVKANRPIGTGMVIASLINLVLNLVFIPLIGRDAAAMSTLVAEASLCTYLFVRSQARFPVPYRFGRAALVTAVTLAGAVILSHVRSSDLLATLAVKVPATIVGLAAVCFLALSGPARRWRNCTQPVGAPLRRAG